MVKEVTFLDTRIPGYTTASKGLVGQGWKAVRNTSSNRFAIQVKYAYYLADKRAAELGLNSASKLNPTELSNIWKKAGDETNNYEMYVRNAPDSSQMNINNNSTSMPVVEEFATADAVERMQPDYIDIDDILAGLGSLSLGGKRRKYSKSKKNVRHTKKHRKTRNRRK